MMLEPSGSIFPHPNPSPGGRGVFSNDTKTTMTDSPFPLEPTAAEAQAAIQGLAGQALEGRALTVNIARPQEPRGGPAGGGYRGGGGGRGRY